MPINVRCTCGRSFKARDESAGLTGRCPSCGASLEVPIPAGQSPTLPGEVESSGLSEGLKEDLVGITRDATLADLWKVLSAILDRLGGSPIAGAVGSKSEREYKVITQKDKWFSGKFDPEKLENALNSYAKQGWAVKGVATASIPGFGGTRDEIVILMER